MGLRFQALALRMVDDERLPWESRGEPQGVGVCLSGGGVRAAAFALGAVQALQSEKKLLFGPRCADILVGVSGGSYVAAAATLNASHFAAHPEEFSEPEPLAVDSPEARHIVHHGRYLFGPQNDEGCLRKWMVARNGFQVLALAVINVAAALVIFLWVGTIIGDISVVSDTSIGRMTGRRPSEFTGWLLWTTAAIALGALAVTFRGLYYDAMPQRIALRTTGVLLLAVTSPQLSSAVGRVAWLSQPSWWLWWPLASAAVVIVVVGLLSLRPPPLPILGEERRTLVARALILVSAWCLRAVGALLLCFAVTEGYTWTSAAFADQEQEGSIALGVIFAGAVLAWVTSRASLHRWNRERISSAFAVLRQRSEAGVLHGFTTALSELEPPTKGGPRSFPRLLISATVNLKHIDSQGRRRRFAALVFSHDRCGVPSQPKASFPTTDLDGGEVPSGWPPHRDPLMSLMTAVACTGAAVSPALGRYSTPTARTLCALLNFRLGTWLPNPLSAPTRRHVEAQRSPWTPGAFFRGIGGGYDEFVPELVGLDRANVPRAYVSDGGHYDNLGLIALLRARCAQIWCVDSQADANGAASQLRDVIQLACDDVHIDIALDLGPFAGKDGVLGAVQAIGTIRYTHDPHQDGTLIVIKLGMTAQPAYAELRAYKRDMDRKFPSHSTFRVIGFGPARMDAYRRLGYLNTCAAIEQWRRGGCTASSSDSTN